jgi:hypothetical protein
VLHLQDRVEEIATGRAGHIDNIQSGAILGQEPTPNLWRVHFSDGKMPLMQYFKSEEELRLVKCPHEEAQPGFVPERGIMD